MVDRNRKLTFIDLFAGCGGLSLGLENAGFQPVFVSELNEEALKSYHINRVDEFPYLTKPEFHVNDVKELVMDPQKLDTAKSSIFELIKDINNVDTADVEVDLLVGGPPCQGYSGIGHRRFYSVDKVQLHSNHLYQDMAFLINAFQPKMFLFENVRGLLNSKWTSNGEKGEIWKDVKTTFRDLKDYSVRHTLVHAKEYGVPQNRPRVLLVGIRKDLVGILEHKLSNDEEANAIEEGLLPDPTSHSFKTPHLEELLSDLIDPNHKNGGKTASYVCEPQNEIQKEFRTKKDRTSYYEKGETLTEQDYSNHKPKVIEKFKSMQKNEGTILPEYQTKKFSQRMLKQYWGENGPNITATSLPDDYVHWAQPRTLTVREWARLQTFPDWYQFEGKRTTGGIRRAGNPRESIHYREVPKYTQIGNAVPVQLAYILGTHFKKILEKVT